MAKSWICDNMTVGLRLTKLIFQLKSSGICKPTHFTFLTCVSTYLPKVKIYPLNCEVGTHQQKYRTG